ncbi:UPF0528 protein CG10038 [Selaginella moellendorffii]|uniref:UPF0528 protein CG10038 n=1 Tax=Selaginella moellendorffii TaxID=88036 RepID=UPI000D1CE129|nr:UPF0528 protein CG10038 [Selaginella moellendorffii]XP_024520001.1 UPF0528 protein CG10038 [Selaginella moellendorffii]XP_024520002.1 UPF0528 protein CG10038 [Selaginella moellendorffii]|eukprot:XP_024520000.1 UPF0528 protein CG10038 [Selaginella moellendorffii]
MVETYGMTRETFTLKRTLALAYGGVVQKMESTVFLSSNAKTARALVILLCGRGELNAGQWSRSLCLTDSLRTGSVLPFLEWAHELDIAVLVLNPNEVMLNGKKQQASFEALLDHVLCAWDLVSATFPDKMLALVAHAYGGTLAIELLKHRGWGALQRLRCIAFCDAQIPDGSLRVLSYDQLKFLEGNAVNWVSSQEPLDKRLCGVSSPDLFGTIKKNPMEHLSSGTTKGDGVVMSAFDSICNFILSKLDVPDNADREGRDEQSESSAQGV